MDRPARPPAPEVDPGALDAIAALPLDQVEETSGELHRRVSVALRRIGERLADDAPAGEPAPRRRVAELAALVELAAHTLAAAAAGVETPNARIDRHPASAAAVMYAAPTIDGLLQRLEQNRRLLTSYVRHLESRLDSEHHTPWGHGPLRVLLVQAAIVEPARCAQALEGRLAGIEEAEIRRLAEAAATDIGGEGPRDA